MLCAFVTPQTPPFDVVFNRLAARVTGGDYCHVEVAFESVPLSLLRNLRKNIPDSDSVSSELQHIGATLNNVLSSFPPDTPDDHTITLAFHALNGCPLGCRIRRNTRPTRCICRTPKIGASTAWPARPTLLCMQI